MNKQEVINKIKGMTVETLFSNSLFVSQPKVVGLIEQIEEPYKPVIPYYIADYLEKVKSEGDLTVVGAVNEAPDGRVRDWLFLERVNTFAQAWVNGYTVEGEPRYTVRIKGVDGYATHLNQNLDNQEWFFASNYEIEGYRIKHTRKELESNGYGWVFTCEGIEVKEVTDE
jgi:hypothetical protein